MMCQKFILESYFEFAWGSIELLLLGMVPVPSPKSSSNFFDFRFDFMGIECKTTATRDTALDSRL